MFKSGKACGPDGIPSEFYKSISHVPKFTDYLTALFNTIFESGTYPEEWTKCAIFPLHKEGDINNVNNYRDISLLNVQERTPLPPHDILLPQAAVAFIKEDDPDMDANIEFPQIERKEFPANVTINEKLTLDQQSEARRVVEQFLDTLSDVQAGHHE
ncbi:retrovirus-related Pol polyprotein LINE-1 [Elysia marginata]|uniref:Retrovirus-related Pol polyprotein LINE-1 n=1 Tax=Elysia marginata TaxID=1093978 RepID=A0AAV4GCU6_9GAST|nr:retrovirus-related Pol polyprotein LINE-1 [Elysia marginata]